mmetsp:Transcript_928/g.1327  ORF Transcript_928/g.1327 Transcript_928/m.1327 type:complete len:442 (-) Transcript_928:219-1544(-)|eukprot:CAMPEP_0194211392 /NCGR_PEP_ID=MMETSP0156-20130528/10213_1 /TAXON_ID=33649 /ORGANISM="Thalassionema nitzschioides, Strain L26-B" /LENGTH=441 /DNA_ID=CAMNT_0038938925 /DNA_START=136 /DNA_END=1461 /DNA_ORIENTATION=-
MDPVEPQQQGPSASPTHGDVDDSPHDDVSPPSSPSPEENPPEIQARDEDQQPQRQPKKPSRKKRKPQTEEEKLAKKAKKRKSKDGSSGNDGEGGRSGKRPRNKARRGSHDSLSAAQLAVNEQMRRALEDDKYSALGSIVDTDTDDDEHDFRTSRGGTIRLDRNTILTSMRKRLRTQRLAGSNVAIVTPNSNTSTTPSLEDQDEVAPKKKKVKTIPPSSSRSKGKTDDSLRHQEASGNSVDVMNDDILGRDEGSIFGQTTGASNATWVECDKCKKWRRLRGVVDEKKLPSKWYCSMNKNDPERARCSAPEEDYETPNTPESAADARTRKHLRVWVRRLESNENYEARMHPTMTRGKKRSAAACSKEPYEWIRCCNPSCGKWRALLRCMDAKHHVIDRTVNGEWYCVMNTWDEKMASCAAPQENLPVIGCPPWVMQDNNKASE